jgi:hypothetical protein
MIPVLYVIFQRVREVARRMKQPPPGQPVQAANVTS